MSDIEPRVPLGDLDPGRDDPSFWDRFHARVMEAAGPHFAAKYRGPLTMGDALLSWSRLVLPFAATAAAIAALLLMRSPQVDDLADVAVLEELLHQPNDGEAALPSFLYWDAEVDRDMILLALEEF
jgi:hypothetical protein